MTIPPVDDDDELVRRAVGAAPVMIWMTDVEGRFEWFSAGWETYIGRPADKLRGAGWQDLVHAEDLERFDGIYAASIEARRPFVLDYRLLRRDGKYRWVLDNGAPRYDDDGAFAGHAGAIVEIHERKELEERLAERTQALRLAERRQGAFLAMLSHELRNPLAPIANAASVLRTLEQGNPTLARLRVILERQVGRLRHLVEDLIDATRAAQGQISLISERITVETLVQNAVAASAETLAQAGHRLDVTMPEGSLTLNGDLARLTQALSGILGNAAKFTAGPSVIRLEVREVAGRVEIAVRDRGQGIARAFLPHVFELFAQQDQSLTRKSGGLGVGLTLAQRIVQMHAGSIRAESGGPDQGATFVVSLPLVDANARNGDASDGPPLSESYRVLVIENDDDGRNALQLQMEMWGNEVRSAATAEEGLRAAEAFKPHIVLCDVGLPDQDGLELLDPLRKALAGQRTLFAAVTGVARREDEIRALSAGYDSFLVKPVQAGSLARLLRSYAGGKR